jgi:hypothetical protein
MPDFVLYHGELMVGEHTSMANALDACELCERLGCTNLTIMSADGLRMWHWN